MRSAGKLYVKCCQLIVVFVFWVPRMQMARAGGIPRQVKKRFQLTLWATLAFPLDSANIFEFFRENKKKQTNNKRHSKIKEVKKNRLVPLGDTGIMRRVVPFSFVRPMQSTCASPFPPLCYAPLHLIKSPLKLCAIKMVPVVVVPPLFMHLQLKPSHISLSLSFALGMFAILYLILGKYLKLGI